MATSAELDAERRREAARLLRKQRADRLWAEAKAREPEGETTAERRRRKAAESLNAEREREAGS